MLTNVKMPTIVGILTFIRRIEFVLSLVEHDKYVITSISGFTTRDETTGHEGLHCNYRYIRISRRTLCGYVLQKRSHN